MFQFSPVVHHPLARTGTSRFYWFLIPPPNYFELNNNKINILAMKCVFPTIINHIEVIPSTYHNFLILKFALQYWQLLKFFISNCRISMNWLILPLIKHKPCDITDQTFFSFKNGHLTISQKKNVRMYTSKIIFFFDLKMKLARTGYMARIGTSTLEVIILPC